MKWDYWTYTNQPIWFIEGLRIKMNLDSQYQEAEARRASRKR